MKEDLFYRSFELDRKLVDEKNRTVPVSFSSEKPVKRWFGDEYLLHSKGAVDLSRLKQMGTVLLNHDPSRIVGPLTGAKIEDSRGVAVAGFDDDEIGNMAIGKVKSGSLRGVSVGYRVIKFRDVMRDEEYELPDGRKIKGPAMVATRWVPFEVTLTPIPADSSVGVGRALTRSLDGIQIETASDRSVDSGLEVFSDLVGRSMTVSPDCRNIVIEMAAEGASRAEILDFIEKSAPEPDAGNTSSRDSDGTPGEKSSIVDRISGDDFADMVMGVRN